MKRLLALTLALILICVSLNAQKTRRVAGEDLPASAFAYAGDPADPKTWKLPIEFSTEQKTKTHIRSALARFRQTRGIPESDRAKVWTNLEAAAKKHGIAVRTAGKRP